MIKRSFLLIVLMVMAMSKSYSQVRTTGQQTWNYGSLATHAAKTFSPRSMNGPYECMPVRLREAFIKAELDLNKHFVSDPNFTATVELEITGMRNALPDVRVITFSPVTLELTAQKPSAIFNNPITSAYNDIDYIQAR